MRAEDILTVFNDMEPVNLDELEYCVITAGSRYHPVRGEVVKATEPRWWPFQPGEVLVVSLATGREPFGEGRKPYKWDVAEHFLPDFTAARALGKLVTAEGTKPGWYRWEDGQWQPVGLAEAEARVAAGEDGWRVASVLRSPGAGS